MTSQGNATPVRRVQPDQDDSRPALSTDGDVYDHEDILGDIDGCIHAAVPGFFEKFFEGESWFSKLESSAALSQLVSDVLKLGGNDVRYHSIQPSSHAQFPIILFSAKGKSESEPEVVGVLSSPESSNYKDGLLELCGNARAVFCKRPHNLVVHGFLIYANIMECWMFDRSGIYSCEPFNIPEDPERFLTIMASYVLMKAQGWGRGTLIEEGGDGIYVSMDDDSEGPGKMYLQTPLFCIINADQIIRGGLVCHRGRTSSVEPWDFVVKYKWKPSYHEPEAAQLRKARDRHVWGINLRAGLAFGPPQQFKNVEAAVQTEELRPPAGDLKSISKHDGAVSDENKAAVIGVKALLEPFQENRPNLPKSPGFRSTIFSCLIISPPGLPIFQYISLHQLLEGLRDAIKAHRSLYQDGGILHRDIAASNIIIPPQTSLQGSPKGLLIDLDTAWDISRGPTPQGSMVGTSPFMAIGALEAYVKDNPRTYRHDLEAFFYVFIFLAICPREADGTKATELPSTSRLLNWKLDKRQQVRKTLDMEREGFQNVLKEFSPEFEGLKGFAEKLRSMLFPVKDGSIWTWTDMSSEGTNKLYDDMIGAFEDEIASVAKL